jgi:type II secretory pathway pseudopilin PulG
MSDRPSHHDAEAFTLIEVVIFIAISSIILISIVSLSVNITRQTNTSHHKLYATRYADELAEWLRIQKEISWQDFYTKSQMTVDRAFCVNDTIALTDGLGSLIPFDPVSAPNDCPYAGITYPDTNPAPKIFRRTVVFDAQADNTKSVKGTIRVEWREAGNAPYSVQIETLFAPR